MTGVIGWLMLKLRPLTTINRGCGGVACLFSGVDS